MSDLQLTPHQQTSFEQLRRFLTTDDHQVFLLRGYAGTGKTTLVRFLLQFMADSCEHLHPILLASTGRAAKILERRTGQPATTLHSHIYTFKEVDDGNADPTADYNQETQQLSLCFELRAAADPEHRGRAVYFIDEASMLSHVEAHGDTSARFGSGSVLTDFLNFVGRDRIVFIGDPAQLPPPVGKDSFSSALSAEFLREHYGLRVAETELTEVIRQGADVPILQLATRLRREVYAATQRADWQILMRDPVYRFFTPFNQNILADRYLKTTGQDFSKAVIITHSNKQTHYLNNIIRTKRFGAKQTHRLQPDELLQITQNNYLVPLSNGDQVLVRKARPYGRSAGFFFLMLHVEDISTGIIHEVPLLYDFLFETRANLAPEDFRRLLIDFDRRARARGIKRKSEDYRTALSNDPYINALRAKFGYAVTCHKAQGGEWDTVFLNLSQSLDRLEPEARYRWLYTAVTRAEHRLELKHVYQPPKADRQTVRVR